MSAVVDLAATQNYLRQVRRARHVHRSNPVLLHSQLKQLSDIRPVLREIEPKSTFAVEVANSLDAGLLRYTKRTDLLRRAAILGISRFEANLIIATEEHRAGQGWKPEATQARRPLPIAWLTFAAVQATIVCAIWWMIS